MKNHFVESATLADTFSILINDGIVVLPSKLGYGILALQESAVERFYHLKNRPLDKPSGILATPEIFKEVTNSVFSEDVSKFNLPVGLIEIPDWDHPAIQALPNVTTLKGSIAFFLNLDPFMTKLAKLAWKKNLLITLSSANKAGFGNSLFYEELHHDFKINVDLSIEGDDLTWKKERGKFDYITSTIIDLPRRRLIRDGIFADRVKAVALELNMITEHLEKLPLREKQQASFSSCIFLLAYKENTYRKIPHIRNMDLLVLDLEDSCPTNKKSTARKMIEKNVHSEVFDRHFVAIRLNELEMEEELDKDLQINFTKNIYAFALPKLRTVEDLKRYENKVAAMESRLGFTVGTFKLFPIIETVEGFNNAREIAKGSPRNVGLFLGHADLFSETYGDRNDENLHHVRSIYLNAAREAGIMAFDTPFENVKDLAGLEKDTQAGKRIGLDGKVALNFDQQEIINKAYSISPKEKEEFEHLINSYKGGCHISNGVFLAPPIIKKIENNLKKKVYQPNHFKVSSVKGKTIQYGLDFRNAFAGQIIESPYETTIDESWITNWQSMVQTGNPLETSLKFCHTIGLENRLVPFQLLVNLGLCLVVESFSESSLFHLGISNVVYEKPVFPKDTLRSLMIIDDIVPASNKKYTVFKTRMILVNQYGEVVVSMNRNSLFPYISPSNIPNNSVQEKHPDENLFFQETDFSFRDTLLKSVKKIKKSGFQKPHSFKNGDLVLHSLARPMGLSNSLAYSTLYKNTHPLHINNARFGMDGLVVCGGFIIPIIHSSASRDIRFAIDHEIIDTMHINKIHHEDAIGAMTYIIDVRKVNKNLECLTLRTFGLKNIDPERDLKNIEIPHELLRSPKIKPREIELICKTYCPELHAKICARMTWRMWRAI